MQLHSNVKYSHSHQTFDGIELPKSNFQIPINQNTIDFSTVKTQTDCIEFDVRESSLT